MALAICACIAWPGGAGAASKAPQATSPPTVAPSPSYGPPPAGLSQDDWSSICAAYEAGRHAAYAVERGYRARNPRQQYTTRFDGRGFTTSDPADGWSWGLELVRYGWSGAEHAVDEPQRVSAEGGRVAYTWDARVTEWYVNDLRGLEHGYTVHERVAGSDGPLTFDLRVRGELRPEVSADRRDVRFVDRAGKTVLTFAGLAVFDADGRSLTAGWRASPNTLQLRIEDHGARYPLTIDPLVQKAYVKASNTGSGDQFGALVAVSGDTVVVGAPTEDSSATGVNGDQSDNGASNSGAAYVFVRSGKTWSQQAYLKASNTGQSDFFGLSVAISDDTIVVGAYSEDSSATGVNGSQNDNSTRDAGAAYVFTRSGTTWSQQAYLKASNPDEWDNFGWAVAVSDDTVVVGAFTEDSNATGVNGTQTDDSAADSGAAYVFVRSGTTWSQQAYLKASNTDAGDQFAMALAISDDTIVVGAAKEDSDSTGVNGSQGNNPVVEPGAAYVFVRSGTTWSQQAYLKASNSGAADNFGWAVAIDADTVVVAAPWEDSSATGVNGNQNDDSTSDSGAVYVFVRSGTTWSQQAYLKASNTGVNDRFGGLEANQTVSISGDTIVVGASTEDSKATGVNGNQNDDGAAASGASYVFVRSGTTWSQDSYLKASNTDPDDRFGVGVAVSKGTIVVGARFEESSVTGIGGNQTDNSNRAGAVYVFGELEPPVAPSALTATAIHEGRIDLLWSDESRFESGFEVERATGTGAFARIATLAKDTESYTDEALLAETTYSYRVRAVNAKGPSPYTDVSTATTAPPIPTDLAAAAPSNSRIDLTWTDASSTEARFEIWRQATGENDFTPLADADADATELTDTTIAPESAFTYRMRAVNAADLASRWSDPVTVVTPPADPDAGVPASNSDTEVRIAWSDRSGAEDGYEIQRGMGCPPSTWAPLALLGPDTTEYTDSSVTPESTFAYRVRAVNANGASEWSAPICVTTPPFAPSEHQASALSPSRVVVRWKDNSTIETGYILRRALAENPNFEELARLPANTTEYLDETVTQETDYIYDVAAWDGNGTSARVPTDEFRTPALLIVRKAKIKRAKKKKPSKLVATGEFDIGGTGADLAGPAVLGIGDGTVAIDAFQAKGKGFRYQRDDIRLDLKPSRSSSRVAFKLQLTGALVDALDPDGDLTLSFESGDYRAMGTIGLAADQFKPGKLGGWIDPAFNLVSLRAALKGLNGALTVKAAFHAPGGMPETAPDVIVRLGFFSFWARGDQFTQSGDKWVFVQKAPGTRKITLDYAKGKITIALKNVDLGAYLKGPVRVRVGVEFSDVSFEDTPEMASTGKSLKY